MTENGSSNQEAADGSRPTFENRDLLVDSEDDRHVPKVIHDVQWNFHFEPGEWIRPVDTSEEDQAWPYWKIDTRLLNADAYVRMYRIRSTHPKTRAVSYDVVPQTDLIEEYERVDSEQVREAARELPDSDEESG